MSQLITDNHHNFHLEFPKRMKITITNAIRARIEYGFVYDLLLKGTRIGF